MTLEKTYNAAEAEAKYYELWEQSGAFAGQADSNKQPYCIMMPPPNVTGSLHMGHALTFTLQDVLIRQKRMEGRDTLWQPGTDHAGIATQMVVERQLAADKNNQTRHEMGREKFLEKVWSWKAESGGMITRQLRHLGTSLDWSRERFTMDEGLSAAVRKVFVQLYKEGLIYKDKRLVNWDPKMLTAISDLEVEQRDIKGNLWHFAYPVENSDETITVATTRPETMLGDTAVAVHPDDERYKHLVGKFVILPLVGRRIPIIADDYADPETGSGAVKITPAHDFNDFEVGRRNKLEMVNVMDKHAHILDADFIPEKYRGLERYAARKQIVADLEEAGRLVQIEPHAHKVPHGDRGGVPIEPWLSEQWYVDAATLAKPALEAVNNGRIKFVPEQWTNTYNAWLREIEPWCISRQLWWGHQIPAWYDENGKVYVAETEVEAQAQAGAGVQLTRDEDVLDTWFSSALWPFSTLGWPEQTPELKHYYPTDVLVTGFDIIFFWVARMVMMGMHFMKDVPFRTVYIHALVRDEKGQKMSKSKGNIIDPLDMIQQYGCDAMRFALTALSTPGRDIRLSPARIEGYRNFATKLWNAARFLEMNGCVYDAGFDVAKAEIATNCWIITRLSQLGEKLDTHYADHRFDLIAQVLYQFVWNDFCDWYLELSKPVLQGEDAGAKAETQKTAAWILVQTLKFLHPVMPYITEELWAHIVGDGALLIGQSWPKLKLESSAAEAEINWLIALITQIRAVRSELNVPAGAKVAIELCEAAADDKARLQRHEQTICRLARVEKITYVATAPANAAQIVVGQLALFMPLADLIDFAAERARLEKECAKAEQEIAKVNAKLSSESFVSKAPEEVVAEHKQRLVDHTALLERLQAAKKAVGA